MSNTAPGNDSDTNSGNSTLGVRPAYGVNRSISGSLNGVYPSYGGGYGVAPGAGYTPATFYAPGLGYAPGAEYAPSVSYASSFQQPSQHSPYSPYTPYMSGGLYTYPNLYQPQQYPYSPYGLCANSPAGAFYAPGAQGAVFPPMQTRQPAEPHEGGKERPEARPPHVEHVDWSERYPQAIVLRGPNRKEVALTFDDGPDDEWTPKVLDQLAKVNVKATFFIFGRRAEQFPNVLRRIVHEGHIIGNHTYTHPNLTKLKAEEVRSQLERTDAVIRRFTGNTPALFRPPYGALNDMVVQEAIRLKKKIIFWNVDSLDWMQLNAKQVATNILSHVRPGSIILQHAAGGTGENLQGTVDAIPVVVHELLSRGYKFRTVPQLVNIPANQPQ